MRPYIIIHVAMFALMVVSCGGNKPAVVNHEVSADTVAVADTTEAVPLEDEMAELPMPKAADELFDDFVFNFAANRKLQMERVVFPLRMVNGSKVTTVDKPQWKMEYFFMRQGYYTLLFDNERHMEIVKDTSVCHAVVEKIYFNTKSVIQYIFDRRRGAWMLMEVNTIPITQSPNASFLTFYHEFATDSDFQAKHLDETVKFVGQDPDDDFAQMEGVITPDTWEAFAPDLPKKMIYNITYGRARKESDTKIFVLRGIANGMELVMTFQRAADSWKLVKLAT